MEVSVNPNGQAIPHWCLEGCFPRRGHGLNIEQASKFGDGGADALVSHDQRLAAEKVVRSRGWPAHRIDPLQGGDEVSQRSRRLDWIGDALDDRVVTCEPAVDGPLPGVALARCPQSKRDRDGKWQVRGESWQPPLLLLHLLNGPVDAGEPHGHVLV